MGCLQRLLLSLKTVPAPTTATASTIPLMQRVCSRQGVPVDRSTFSSVFHSFLNCFLLLQILSPSTVITRLFEHPPGQRCPRAPPFEAPSMQSWKLPTFTARREALDGVGEKGRKEGSREHDFGQRAPCLARYNQRSTFASEVERNCLQ